jgi:hypothetical protein
MMKYFQDRSVSVESIGVGGNDVTASSFQRAETSEFCSLNSTDTVTDDQAGDPELEDLQYTSDPKVRSHVNAPLAAWVLTSIFLLSVLQKNYSDNVIGEISHLLVASNLSNNRRNKPFSKRVMIFCLTLAGYSSKAYRYLRTVVNNCVPSQETLRKYRNKVDGSPGFSVAAFRMIERKVCEINIKSKNLFLSLSCDDMSIRNCIYFKPENKKIL